MTSTGDGALGQQIDRLERPSWVTERTWRRFLAVELHGHTLVRVARDEGVSKSAVAQSVIKARAACRASPDLSLRSWPISLGV